MDLYDRHTVELCRQSEESAKKIDLKDEADKEEAARAKAWAIKMMMYFETGERYLKKDKTIREWMDRDQKRDELYESAQPPEDIRCLICRNRVTPTFKELWTEHEKPDRVLFMFDCINKCLPRRAFFSDGEEWRRKPNLCTRCGTELEESSEDNGEKLITKTTCPVCQYTDVSEKDKESWYSSYDFQSRFNVKSPTLRKWVRQGIVKARTITIYGKGVHMQVYLIEDNKDFLPPKSMTESRGVTTRRDGKDWFTTEPWYRFVDPRIHLKDYRIMDHLRVVDEKEEEERK